MKRKKRKEERKNKIFVVIPAYNEALRIGEVIRGVKKFCKNIIVVDDGSKDETDKVARKNKVIVLRHRLNLGKGAAMKTGVEAAFELGGEGVILIDADGQHQPREIPKFIKNLSAGYDIVFGSRELTEGVPLVRHLGNKFGSMLITLFFGISRSDMLCGFMAFSKKTYQKIRWDSSQYGVETEIVARTGKNRLKYTEVVIETIYIDKYKGVLDHQRPQLLTPLDAIGILFNIPRWKFS